MTDERRSSPRFACNVETALTLSDGAFLPGNAVDISFAGACLLVEVPVPSSTAVTLSLALTFEGAADDDPARPPLTIPTLALPGTVVWCTPTKGQYQLGVAFARDLSDVTMARLDVLLQAISDGKNAAAR